MPSSAGKPLGDGLGGGVGAKAEPPSRGADVWLGGWRMFKKLRFRGYLDPGTQTHPKTFSKGTTGVLLGWKTSR